MSKKIASLFLALTLVVSGASYGHSGRTDGSGGHKDNKNKSGLGSYHYHHGYSAHLHDNGICPYDAPADTDKVSIKDIQDKLNELGYDCGKVDGKLGPKTTAALKAFQKDNKLTVDGKAGPKTLEALGL